MNWKDCRAITVGLLIVSAFVSPAAGAERPSALAVRLESAPALDGKVLGDPAWGAVPELSGFTQTTPDEGQPASERTTVRIGFTDDTLFIGAVMYDREPAGIIVSDSRRDSSLDQTDSIRIVIDTFMNQQSGFLFGTNPAGIEYDGQYSEQGDGFNRNWDGSWRVETHTGEFGWSAELAIPFRTIRYPSTSPQSWGVNVQRNIRRRNESAYWAPLERQFGIFRLVDAGRLDGVEIPSHRNLKVTPYVLGEVQERDGIEGRDEDIEIGADLKYSVTPSLTLDLTYNTDFAQVEVDEQVVNLDRFNVFFPEKRPFFLENAGLFSVGVDQEIELFHSRRIGIGQSGEIIPILGGARLSGKVGHSNVGILLMQTEETDTRANNFGVARISREYTNRSNLGALFVARSATGDLATSGDDNYTYAVDGTLGIGRFGSISGFVAQTDTPGAKGDEHAYQVRADYDSETWRFFVDYTEVGDDFNPEVGFLQRSGFRKPSGLIYYRYRPEDLWGLLELRPHASYTSYFDFDGFQETGRLHVDNHWEWRNGYEVHTGINFTHEGVTDDFVIYPGVAVPVGTYKHEEAQLVFRTNQGAPLSLDLTAIIGGFFGGDRVSLRPTVRFRTGEKFTTELSWSYNDIDLPGGSFETNLGKLRLSYSFTPKMFVEALVQYNDRTDDVTSNWRLGWLQTAKAGLYIVYNETNELGDSDLMRDDDRKLIVKYSHVFDVLN